MTALTPGARKFALTAHVIASVGWLGAVAAFLAVALASLTNDDVQLVRAAYRVMELMGWTVIVPFGAASLVTGLVQSLGTPWGLFRHWWVVLKLLLTALALLVLLVHLQPIDFMADIAAKATLAPHDHRAVRIQLVFDAGAALLVLLVNTTLSVYKPRGLTRYGQRRLRAERAA